MLEQVISKIQALNCGNVVLNESLAKYTTYKVGGIAPCIVSPYNERELIRLLQLLKRENVKYKVLGNGSNVIFDDQPYEGIIIKLDEFDTFYMEGNRVIVGAGYSLIKLALKVSRLGYSGLEFAAGIPGTLGGSVFMNAGAYQSDMGYVVDSIKVLTPDFKIKRMYNHELDFHYRTSFLKKHPDYICLEVTIVLRPGNREEIMEVIQDRKSRRLATQPLEYPTAGSVFRNPEGHYAGKLIEDIGYKGKRIGGAMVSEKHANFIINYDHATASDIKSLIRDIQKKVKKETGIELKLEQEIVE